MYTVRVKRKNKKWEVIAEFESKNEAMKCACRLDLKWRRDSKAMYNHIEVVFPDKFRFPIC